MPIYNYACIQCETHDKFFDHEIRDSKAKCTNCGNTAFKRMMSVPLDNKITQNTKDYYTGAQAEKGIEQDLRKRSTKHTNDTMQEFHQDLIQQYGEVEATKMMKENGFLVSDDRGKTWRYRNDFDTGTLNAQNSGSTKINLGKK